MTADLERLAELEAAATPGEWVAVVGAGDDGLCWIEIQSTATIADRLRFHDAALIAEVRNALPDLLRRVQEAEDKAERWGADRARLRASLQGLTEIATRVGETYEQLDDCLTARAEAAEARVAELEAGIKALADEHDCDCGDTICHEAKYAANLRALLAKDGDPA